MCAADTILYLFIDTIADEVDEDGCIALIVSFILVKDGCEQRTYVHG